MGGLSTAIRLAKHGFNVNVFEKNSYPGGKLSELTLGKYRFDKGPSLFTMPALVEELKQLSNYPQPFSYKKLNEVTHYFWDDATRLKAYSDKTKLAKEINNKLGEREETIIKYLNKSEFYYNTTSSLFLEQSLHQFKNFFNIKTLNGVFKAPFLNLNKTMHQQNESSFKNAKTVQLFNRYATYNGSNPYQAPALLNMIPHLEFGLGAYLPENGMHQITEYLVEIAKYLGVNFHFNSAVDSIVTKNNQVKGVKVKNEFIASDLIVSDVDIQVLYKKLLPLQFTPIKMLNQQKSSSAFVYYWGINKNFNELGLHNILFSSNYKQEFDALFNSNKPCNDPTIYINITSKHCKNDAPENCENWFVMVNVPHNSSGLPITYEQELRKNIIRKINHILNTDIEQYIEVESKLDPFDIEQQTSSYGGSLYGNSSNNKFSAFLRHANYSSKLKGLYLVGGSVHPGGGIPLCLLSGKIATDIIMSKHKV